MPASNLSKQASRDLVGVIDYSAMRFGERHADRLEREILDICARIAAGDSHGFIRHDVSERHATRFITLGVVVIAYNPKNRKIIRIVDGRRNVAKLFRS